MAIPALGPGCGPRSPYVPFYGGISAPPHSLSQGQRTGGLHKPHHGFDLLPFWFRELVLLDFAFFFPT